MINFNNPPPFHTHTHTLQWHKDTNTEQDDDHNAPPPALLSYLVREPPRRDGPFRRALEGDVRTGADEFEDTKVGPCELRIDVENVVIVAGHPRREGVAKVVVHGVGDVRGARRAACEKGRHGGG